MKIYIKWANLNNDQKSQIKSFYNDEITKKELFEHDLNKQSYLINVTSGSVVFRKDF